MKVYRDTILMSLRRQLAEAHETMARVMREQDAAREWMRGLAKAVPPPESV